MMPSRTADHLFGMSRYPERAEKLAERKLSTQHGERAKRVRGSMPGEEKC